MIRRRDALKHGFGIVDGSAESVASRLNALIPGALDQDGVLNVEAIKEATGAAHAGRRGYELTFAGKFLARYKADTPPVMELKAEKEQSKNFDGTGNMLIRGDNLEVLKMLKQNYEGAVKMTYIDPPYNENDGFVYNDDFRKSEAELIEDLGLEPDAVDQLHDMFGTKTHSGWLTFMYPRLKIARELLTEDGVIFISIGDGEVHNLRLVMDEVFGGQNFAGHAHWRRRHNQPNDPTKMIAVVTEHVLVYAKNMPNLREAGVGKVGLTGSFSNKDNDPRGRWGSKPWKAGSGQSGTRYTVVTPTGQVYDEEWMGDEDTFRQLRDGNRIIFPRNGAGQPRKKYFESEREREGQAATNWWEHEIFGSNQNASDELASIFGKKNVFSNPKPLKLMMNIITIGNCKDGDIVLDFFAGSGTTGEAVMRLNAEDGRNRKFILVQWDEEIKKKSETKAAIDFCRENGLDAVVSNITVERLSRAGRMIEEKYPESNADTGYRIFALKEKPSLTDEGEMRFDIHLRSPIDVLYNMMCSTGKPLDANVRVLVEDALYEVDGEIYMVKDADIEGDDDVKINIDGWGDISLEKYLNLGRERINIIY